MGRCLERHRVVPRARSLAAASAFAAIVVAGCGYQPGGPTPGPDEVLIPGGTFIMGHKAIPMTPGERNACGLNGDCSDYAPPHPVTLPPYYIDRYQVTVADYITCVKAGRCEYPDLADPTADQAGKRNWEEIQKPAFAHFPMTYLQHRMMVEYCEWKGKRLPTEAEWEHAARGAGDWDYPWGPDLPACPEIPEMCPNFWKTHPGPGLGLSPGLYPVGSVPKDRTPTGIYDLYGDGSEEVSDWYSSTYYGDLVGRYGARPVWDPQGPAVDPLAYVPFHVERAPLGSGAAVWALKAWDVSKRGIPAWARSEGTVAITFRCAHGVAAQSTLP